MVLSHVCPFVGTPAQFPVLSLPTCRKILKYIEFLRYNSIAKISNNAIFDTVSSQFVDCVKSTRAGVSHQPLKMFKGIYLELSSLRGLLILNISII